jgi:hypothetical protein
MDTEYDEWDEWDDRRKTHQALGLVPVTVEARTCVEGCNHFVLKLNWCRLKLCPAPGGCPENTVLVSYRRGSYRPDDAGHGARKPRGD